MTDQINSDQQVTGVAAMRAAEVAAAEKAGEGELKSDPPGTGTEIPGKDLSQMGNPFAGRLNTGTALESNEEVLTRMTGGAGSPEVVPPQDQGAGQVTAPQKATGQQSEQDRQSQAENDRLTAENVRLQEEASIGRYVMGDDRLAQMAADSMRGVTTQPGMDGLGYDESLIKSLGLPEDFVFNPDEMYIPGTASEKVYRATIDHAVDTKVDAKVASMRQQEEMRHKGQVVRERFLAAGHSDDDLKSLMEWTGDGGNFTLEKLWSYMTGQLAPSSGADVLRPPPPKQHVSSISGIPGAGAAPEVSEEVQVAASILRLAEKRKNPFLG